MIDTYQREGRVLLIRPEHLLSFKLMGVDRSWAKADEGEESILGQTIIGLYRDFGSTSSDIVDESDERFSVKFDLIYTVGMQAAAEMNPDRWILVQELLDITELVVPGLMGIRDISGGRTRGSSISKTTVPDVFPLSAFWKNDER